MFNYTQVLKPAYIFLKCIVHVILSVCYSSCYVCTSILQRTYSSYISSYVYMIHYLALLILMYFNPPAYICTYILFLDNRYMQIYVIIIFMHVCTHTYMYHHATVTLFHRELESFLTELGNITPQSSTHTYIYTH